MLRRAPAWLLHLMIPLLMLLPLLWALLPGGLPNSADGMVHFTRITEIVSSWRDGIWVPRWSLNLGFGYGVPVFIFGPPLAYWLGALYNVLGFGPEAAYKAMLVTVLFVGATGSYRLGQALLGIWAGAVAAVAFLYAPNQLFTLFVQGNAPQLLAWSLMAWALWATVQIYRAERPHEQLLDALALALAVSGTMMSHNVVTLILAPTLALLSLLLWLATRRHRALWISAAGGVLGGLMGAWFVAPALLETVYASTAAIVASDYRTRFVPLAELLAWPVRLDAGAINPYIPRTLGLPQVIAALLGMLALFGWFLARRKAGLSPRRGLSAVVSPERPLRGDRAAGGGGSQVEHDHFPVLWATALFMALYALFGGWMATRWSALLWERLPILEFLQFPARWIGFATFGLAWLAAATVGPVARRVQPIVAGALCLFLLTTSLVYLYPDKTPPGTRAMSAYDVVRYELRSGAIGTTSYGEFNPRWAPRPLPPSPMVEDYMARQPVDRLKGMLPAGSSHRTLEVTAHRQRYAITLAAPATVSMNLLYFPGWRATINGAPATIWPQAGTGLITMALPAGESVLDLTFGPTPLRRMMNLLSGAAWVALALAFVVTVARRAPVPSPQRPATGELSRAVVIFGAVSVLVLALQSVGAAWFQLHSPPDQALAAPVPRHEDVDALFRLLGQNALPETVRAGETLPVVAYWRALDDMDENYAVVMQLVDVASGQLLVGMEQAHPNDIPTSGWATGLYVRNEWQVSIPTDALPVQYALRTGFRHPDTGEMLAAGAGNTVELGRLWVLPRVEPEPPAGPRAHFGSSIELLGATTEGGALTLYWRTNLPISDEYSIFVHLLDANGAVVGQMDGLPFANRYPTWAWRPGQVIEDRREVAAEIELKQVDSVAVGLYNPVTGERLVATGAAGERLPNDAQMIIWEAK